MDTVRILTQRDIKTLMTPADYLAAVEAGARAAAEGRAVSPAPLHLPADVGGFHAKGALMESEHGAYAVLKFNGNFPRNTDRPTIQGLILLCDARTGAPLAVMDSIEVTLRRTAAASALAARRLARPEANTMSLCGCGAQAWAHLEAFADTFPLAKCVVWDADMGKAAAFAFRAQEMLRIEAHAPPTARQSALEADIVVTSTTVTAPFLGVQDVKAGAFIAAVGADAPHKSEIDPALMARARVYVDVLAQCLAMGDLRHAVEAGAVSEAHVRGDLAGLASGRCAGRERDDEITLFDSTGWAIEDVASAALIFERALEYGAGAEVRFAGF
jgi:ornithine cyclodeaminase/alanine dehydrogenase-like protein (mu-crystallin family)